MDTGERSARALGYFSLGLGLVQIVAPNQLARSVGAPDGRGTSVMLRLVGLRELVAGAAVLGQRRPAQWMWARVAGDCADLAVMAGAMIVAHDRRRLGAAIAAVAGITALDVLTAEQLAAKPTERGPRLVSSITVNRPRAEVQRFWEGFVQQAEKPRELQWAYFNAAPGDRGTEIRIDAPYPAIGASLRRRRVQSELRRAKQLMEAHQVLTASSGSNV